jgi:hypothetical protein
VDAFGEGAVGIWHLGEGVENTLFVVGLLLASKSRPTEPSYRGAIMSPSNG